MSILKGYQKKLIELDSNNKQLLLLKCLQGQHIDLESFGYLYDNNSAFKIIDTILKGEHQQKLCPHLDSYFTIPNPISQQLKQLYERDKILQEEQGISSLYIGYPFVTGKFLNNQIVKAPLLLFKINILKLEQDWVIESEGEANDTITFNKTFLLAYSYFNQKKIDQKIFDYNFKDLKFEDGLTFLTALYNLIKTLDIKLDFNSQTFECELLPFKNETRKDYQSKFIQGALKIQPEALIGLFNQTNACFIRDYDFMLRQHSEVAFKDIFFKNKLSHSEALRHIQETSEKEIYTPFKTDAWQEAVLKLAKKGYSFVVQGPPGSGKSQLICNLIANALIRKQKVLVVCHKAVALDIVYKRLTESNYEGFIVKVIHILQEKHLVFSKLLNQLNYLTLETQKYNRLDKDMLLKSLDHCNNEIEEIKNDLEDFKTAFFDTQECGTSIKQLYLNSDLQKDFFNLKGYYPFFTFSKQNDFLKKIKTYWYYYQRVGCIDHPWQIRKDFSNFDINDLGELNNILDNIDIEAEKTFEQIKQIIYMKTKIDEIAWLKSRQQQFYVLLEQFRDETTFNYFRKYRSIQKFQKAWLQGYKEKLTSCFEGEGMEVSLDKRDLVYCITVIEKARRFLGNWFYKIWWKLTDKESQYLANILEINHLPETTSGLEVLRQRIEKRMNYEHYFGQFSAFHWLQNLPKDRKWSSLEDWFDKHFKVLEAKDSYTQLRNAVKYIDIDSLSFEKFETKVSSLFKWVDYILEKQKIWSNYLTDNQITKILDSKDHKKNLILTLEQDFEVLVEYDRFKNSLTKTELDVLKLLVNHYPKAELEQHKLIFLFQNSIHLAWINHIENKYPILKIVSSGLIEQLETRLQDAIRNKHEVSKKLILIMIYNTIHETLTDTKKLRPSYLDLYRKIDTPKNYPSLRQLFDQFSNEILNTLPCWLVSPDSVSTIWDIKPIFDLVIFDEASQCFAEKSLPILYRAKQAIIIGDSQQLPPQDLYKVRWQDQENTENEDFETESLLQLGMKYLPQLPLLNHFRSKDLALIQFSNTHFYQNKLRVLPDYYYFKKNEPAITYKLIEDGIWHKQSNQPEAESVVELVENLVEKGKESIAIITFNMPQKELIENLFQDKKIYLPADVLIKNIDNIQGDERDIVIFSIGYASNEKGRFYSHFGNLNLPKGSNRLNVAITRAKEKIYIITSIIPSQIQDEQTKREGVKLLKAYLYYAWAVSEGKEKPELAQHQVYFLDSYLKNKIKNHIFKTGIKVLKELPFADLLIENNGEQALLLTDDDLYYTRFSTAQTHGFIPILLKGKNWRFQSIYTRNYWKNKERFFESIVKFMTN